MRYWNKPWVIAGVIVVILIVLLYILPQQKERPSEEATPAESLVSYTLESFLREAKTKLSDNNLQLVDGIELPIDTMRSDKMKALWYDSLATIWSRFQWPTIVAFYLEKAAQSDPSAYRWFKAGDAFFTAFQYSDQFQKENIEKAKYCYEQVLKIEPGNLDAESGLAVCLIEASKFTGSAPMEGIQKLQQILLKDSLHVKTLMNLGYYAMQSGQPDKAMERFAKVLQADSTVAEVYLYMADIYLGKQDTTDAIAFLEKFRDKTDNATLKYQTEVFINKLKNIH